MESRLAANGNAAAPVAAGNRLDGSKTVSANQSKAAANGVAALPEDETNVWPDESAEAAFLAETRGSAEPVMAAPAKEVEEEREKKLPPLEELVQRIPAEARDLIEELFRAKFTAVRRVRKSDLKP